MDLMEEINAFARFIWFLYKFDLCSYLARMSANAALARKRNSITFLERLNGGP